MEQGRFVKDSQIRQYLSTLDIHEFTGPDGRQPQVLRVLADVILTQFLIVFEASW